MTPALGTIAIATAAGSEGDSEWRPPRSACKMMRVKAIAVRDQGRTLSRRRSYVVAATAVLVVVTIRGAHLSDSPRLILAAGVPLTLLAIAGSAQPSPIARVAARIAGVLCLVLALPAMWSLGPALLIAAVLLMAASERPRPT